MQERELINQLEEAQEHIAFLEEVIYDLCWDGHYIPEGVEYLFVTE